MDTAFPLTPWSSILRGEELDDEARRDTLRRLLARYWRPLYSCVRFGWGLDPDDATRRLEEFFYALLHGDLLRDLDPEKGRFREFLKARLGEFMTAGKGPADDAPRETGIADLSVSVDEERTPGDPGEVFDASWVELLIERGLVRCAEEADAGDPGGPFAVFRRIDVDAPLGAADPTTASATLAEELGIGPDQVAERLHEGRKHFRRVMAQQVHDYVVDDADAREELRWTIG